MQFHPVCGSKRPERSYCLLVALKPYFTFTDYEYFTATNAHTICNDIGGSVPKLEKVNDWSRLASTMNYLQNHVRMGWPFSLRWMLWPVSIFVKPKEILRLASIKYRSFT